MIHMMPSESNTLRGEVGITGPSCLR